MGKGNRSRNTRADSVINSASYSTKAKKDNTKLITTVVTIAVAVLLIACIAVTTFVNTGLNVRSKTAVKTDNYSVSGTMLSYFFYSQYQYFLSQYGSYASYFGLDTGSSLKSQTFSEEQTWYDYFMDSAKTQITQLLALCEAANAAGLELTDEDKDSIDETLETLSENALSYGYTLNGFISAMYGTGVNASDVRKCLELTTLASKYSNTVSDELKSKITDDEIKTYVEENPESFLYADTLQYTYTATLSTAGAEATDDEKAAYETAKADMKKLAETLSTSSTSADAFKKAVADYLMSTADELFESLYESETAGLTSADVPTADEKASIKTSVLEYIESCMTDTPKEVPAFDGKGYDEAMGELIDDMYSDLITSGYDTLDNDSIAYSDPIATDVTDTNKWLFSSARKDGDSTVITSEGDSTSTYTVIYLKAAAHTLTDRTVDVAHILISASTAGYDDDDTEESNAASQKAKAKAEEILAQYNAGELTLDAFKALGEENTEDSSVVYEGVYEGQMVAAFEDWCFDESRKTGDTGIVETTYGWHIMYFIGEGGERWYSTAKSSILSENLNTWYEDTAAAYNIVFNSKVINSISA